MTNWTSPRGLPTDHCPPLESIRWPRPLNFELRSVELIERDLCGDFCRELNPHHNEIDHSLGPEARQDGEGWHGHWHPSCFREDAGERNRRRGCQEWVVDWGLLNRLGIFHGPRLVLSGHWGPLKHWLLDGLVDSLHFFDSLGEASLVGGHGDLAPEGFDSFADVLVLFEELLVVAAPRQGNELLR